MSQARPKSIPPTSHMSHPSFFNLTNHLNSFAFWRSQNWLHTIHVVSVMESVFFSKKGIIVLMISYFTEVVCDWFEIRVGVFGSEWRRCFGVWEDGFWIVHPTLQGRCTEVAGRLHMLHPSFFNLTNHLNSFAFWRSQNWLHTIHVVSVMESVFFSKKGIIVLMISYFIEVVCDWFEIRVGDFVVVSEWGSDVVVLVYRKRDFELSTPRCRGVVRGL